MELKVAEAAHEAQAWRERYATLAASTAHMAELAAPAGLGSDFLRPPAQLGHWELLHAPTSDPAVVRELRELRHINLANEGLGSDSLEFLFRYFYYRGFLL